MDSKNIGKAIRKNAKKVIAESGIGSSRSGNKELSHLVSRLSNQPIGSLENAQVLGARLGEKIVELSKASSKNYLDKGVIRTLVITKAIPSVADLPTATAPVNIPESKTRQTSKTAESVASLSSADKAQSVVLAVDETTLEDEAPATAAELIEDAELTENLDSEVSSAQVIEAMAVEAEEDEDEEDEAEDEEGEEAEEAVAELLAEPTEAIQVEDTTAPIATDTVNDPITAEESDAEEPATEIVNSAP
ncbi:hypothetical protein [Leptodesmis sichuanensis]|uniref:hypothetical protein n=2 Tax=Leptodesmis TaxID=2664261 RepID=UPI001F407D3F|nr:hypothetical protein [Leptodesmis sichuanensis]UIE38928.1 hypothetical protein KIK02_04780 [Leptodesmis sichuanensis A121]